MKTTLFVCFLAILWTAPSAADDRFTDKRLARSMQLYRLETGLDSPEVRETLAAKDKELQVSREAMRLSEAEAQKSILAMEEERAKHQQEMRAVQDEMAATLKDMSALLKKQRTAEGDPALGKDALRRQLLATRRGDDAVGGGTEDAAADDGSLQVFALKAGSLEENFARILKDLDFRLVWNAPRYMVEHDYEVRATDMFAALEQIMSAYNERGIPLEASVFSKNLTVEVSLGQWRQKLPSNLAGGVK